MEFVSGRRQHIDVLRFHIERDMPYRLHRIGVEEHPALATDRAELFDRLDGADLVIGGHDSDKTGIVVDRFFQLLRVDDAVLMHGQ